MSQPFREACVKGLESRRLSPASSSRGGQVCCRHMPSKCSGVIVGVTPPVLCRTEFNSWADSRRDVKADVSICTAWSTKEFTLSDTSFAPGIESERPQPVHAAVPMPRPAPQPLLLQRALAERTRWLAGRPDHSGELYGMEIVDVMFTMKREWLASVEGADKMKPVDRKRAWQRHSRNTSPLCAKQIRLAIVHEVPGSGSSHLTSGNTEPTRACAEATPCDRVASGACAPGAPRFEPPGTEAALRVRVIKTSVTACGLSPIATSDGCRAWANNTRIDAEATSTCTRRHPLFSIISQCDRSGPPIRFAT